MKKTKIKLLDILNVSAMALLIYIVSLLITTSLTFIWKGSISYLQTILSSIITIIMILITNKDKKIINKILGILLSILVVFGITYIEARYYDNSWDGNTYHKDAVGALKSGWNPIHDDYIKFYHKSKYRDNNIIGNEIQTVHGLWQTHYAKAPWYINSNFYYLTNDIEAAKVFNLVIVYISLIFIFDFFNKLLNKKILSAILAILYTFSPITIVQMFNNYNDGVLYNTLLLVILSFVGIIIKNDKEDIIKFLLLLSVCINIKFTGFVYAGFFCLFLYFLYFYKNKKDKTKIIKFTILTAITVIFSVVIIGYQPYVTNFIQYHQPFYPLLGKDKVDIMSYNQPAFFDNKNNATRVFYSIFSEAKNINHSANIDPKLKMPFMVYPGELAILKDNDLRIGGFGPLFSMILIISITCLIYFFIKNYKKDKNKILISIVVLVPIILLLLSLSESWWARYSAYTYFISLICLAYLATNKTKTNILNFLIILMFINISFFINNNLLYNYDISKELRQSLDQMQQEEKICFVQRTAYDFVGLLYNLDDRNIQYEYTKITNVNDQRYNNYYSWRKCSK